MAVVLPLSVTLEPVAMLAAGALTKAATMLMAASLTRCARKRVEVCFVWLLVVRFSLWSRFRAGVHRLISLILRRYERTLTSYSQLGHDGMATTSFAGCEH
jgi:hypothetical protein